MCKYVVFIVNAIFIKLSDFQEGSQGQRCAVLGSLLFYRLRRI